MEDIYSFISEYAGPFSLLQTKIIVSVSVLLLLVVVRWLANSLINWQVNDLGRRYRSHKFVQYGTVFLAIFLILRIWLAEFGSLATYLGILSAGIAISLSDMLSNLAGWFFILWSRPFEMGDRIEIGSAAGDVIDMGFFQFTIVEIRNWVDADQSTGRLLHVPNRKIFSEPVANFTHSFPYIWHEIPVLITFESDWQKAKKLLLEIVEQQTSYIVEEAEKHRLRANRKMMIKLGKLTPIVYTAVKTSGVQLTLRFLSGPRRRRGLTSAVWEEILQTFAQQPDIHFAYPTQRVFVPELQQELTGRGQPNGRNTEHDF